MDWQCSSKIRVLLERLEPILDINQTSDAEEGLLPGPVAQKRKSCALTADNFGRNPSKVSL